MKEKLEEVDEFLGYVIRKLKSNNLFHRLNLSNFENLRKIKLYNTIIFECPFI
jgi:hypothetical protein